MVKIIGRLKDVGVGIEAVRGAGLTPTYWIPKSSYTIDDKAEKFRTRESYSSIGMDGNQVGVAKEWAEGDIEFDFYDKIMGVFLYALFGGKSVSGIVDSAYTHTFTLANTNQHPTLSFGVKEGTLQDLMFKLAIINSLEMTVTPNDTVKILVNFLGKKSVGSSLTSSYVANNVFVGRHFSLKLATLTSGLTAASVIPIKSFKLTVEKNAIIDQNLGSSTPTDALNQGFRITGEVELDYENRTYRDLMMAGSYRAMRIALTHTTLIGSTSVPAFKLDLSRVDFDGWEQNAAEDEIVSQKFTFTALYDITNSNIIDSCTLINAIASY